MAIQWGPYEGHLRVGISADIQPENPSFNDTTVDIVWRFYVDSDGWSFNDDQTLNWSAEDFGGGSVPFSNNSSGGAILVKTQRVTYTVFFPEQAGDRVENASCDLTGAYNGATPSKSLNVTKPERPPKPPDDDLNTNVDSISTDDASVNWSQPAINGSSIDNYHVQVDNNSGFGSPTYNNSSIGSGARTVDVNGLNPDTKYYYRVRAKNSAGWGGWSATKSFTTGAASPTTPGAPTVLTRNPTSLQWGWEASDPRGGGALTYTIEISTVSNFSTIVDSATSGNESHIFSGLTAGTTYYARVRAANSGGTSNWSGTGTGTTIAQPDYNDPGPLAQQVVSLGEAVADKLVHLGMSTMRGKTAGVTIPSGAGVVDLAFGTLIADRGPDHPTWDSGNNQFVIQYPGTYRIEFGFRWDEDADAEYTQVMECLVNGDNLPQSSVAKGGAITGTVNANTASTALFRYLVIERQLDVGDTVGFTVNTFDLASSMVQPSNALTDLFSYVRITMVGF